MAKNTYLSTIESKKQNNQVKHNDRYTKCFDDFQMGGS